ncbi:MAG: DMT family transporter [Candidatus Aminicenantes bacterium]|nr:DMT family transporter [Candidatus Aminicenantes bacterium]
MESRLGEFAALLTVLCWTASAHFFETASKRSDSMTVNILRLYIGFFFFCLFFLVTGRMPIPINATGKAWLFLSLSGIVGFALGDYSLFYAFSEIGARISLLIMAAVPPITALFGWLVMGETLVLRHFTGMGLTISGIVIVLLRRRPGQRRIRLSHPVKGVLLALGGALGQAVGLVLSKYGMGEYDAFYSTQIRVVAGIGGTTAILFFSGRLRRAAAVLKSRKDMFLISMGALLGLFLGVSFSLLAVQHTQVGVAATIMAIVPITIIVPSVLIFKEKVTLREVAGAVLAVSGVALLFL